MTKLAAVHQRAQDLVLAIVEANTLPTMRVLQSANLQYQAWHFEFAIIGESHYVRIEHQGKLVQTEILACVELASEDCQLYHPFADSRPFAYHRANYQVKVAFESKIPQWKQSENYLDFAFPMIWGQIPRTRIQWQIGNGSLTWQTLHSYYENSGLVAVVSESEFSFEG